jgi:hypothetical protein
MRAVTVIVNIVEPMHMVTIGMIVIVVVMMMRVAQRPRPIAVIVDVLMRMAMRLRCARLALLMGHFGLTASANAAHQAVSISRAFHSSPQAVRAKTPTPDRGEAPLASRPII